MHDRSSGATIAVDRRMKLPALRDATSSHRSPLAKMSRVTLVVGFVASVGCGGAPANAPPRVGKVAPELTAWLGRAAPGARVGVVADFVNRPRSSDMLALGLSDCLGQPAAPSGPDSQVSFDAYALRHPAPELGTTCFGHPTRDGLLRLIDDASVTSLDAWNDR